MVSERKILMRLMPDRDIKRSIANVKTTLGVEGLSVSRRSIVYGRRFLKGKMTSDEVIEDITKYILKKDRKLKRL